MARPYPIYVVDDDPGIRELIVLMSEDQGIAARTFEGGEQFLAALDSLEPGCVLLDMRMPRKNGIQVQEELAARGRRLPVVAITGYGDVDMAVQSMKLGAVEFLEKPFTTDVLMDAVKLAFQQLEDMEAQE